MASGKTKGKANVLLTQRIQVGKDNASNTFFLATPNCNRVANNRRVIKKGGRVLLIFLTCDDEPWTDMRIVDSLGVGCLPADQVFTPPQEMAPGLWVSLFTGQQPRECSYPVEFSLSLQGRGKDDTADPPPVLVSPPP